jgi:GNAT superfamily N-acetyltransferase
MHAGILSLPCWISCRYNLDMFPYTLTTFAQRPNLEDVSYELNGLAWPAFMLEDPVANEHWANLFQVFPDYQFALLDDEKLIAVGNSLPLAWDGEPVSLPSTGWDWALARGFADHAEGRPPLIQSALSITIHPDYRSKGLSHEMVKLMRRLAMDHGLRALIAPVRPSQKARYPLIPIENYIRWTTPEGLPFDPWLRVHARAGGQIIQPCPYSMTVPGTVAAWERWAGMSFPESGMYTVPGALVPVQVKVETDEVIYVEPNVWVWHAL